MTELFHEFSSLSTDKERDEFLNKNNDSIKSLVVSGFMQTQCKVELGYRYGLLTAKVDVNNTLQYEIALYPVGWIVQDYRKV